MIHRAPRAGKYTMIDRRALEDDRLSFKARGLLAYILSKPDDWNIMMCDLIKQSPQGERAVQSALRELKQYGYARLARERNGKTGFSGSRWDIHEVPIPEDAKTAPPDPDNAVLRQPRFKAATKPLREVLIPETELRTEKKQRLKRILKTVIPLPEELASQELVKAWEDFQEFRRQARHSITPLSAQRMFEKFKAWGPAKTIRALEASIENGWRGVFEPREERSGSLARPAWAQIKDLKEEIGDLENVAAEHKGNPRSSNYSRGEFATNPTTEQDRKEYRELLSRIAETKERISALRRQDTSAQ